MLRARRAIRNRYKTSLGKATARRYRMRSNPGVIGGLMDAVKAALPVAISLYGARALSYKVAGKLPGFNRIPAQYQGSAMAGLVLVLGHVATGTKYAPQFLRKHRLGVMIGTGLNLFDNVLAAFAPASVKGMFGIAGLYDQALSDYVTMSDYIATGTTPIDDDITLAGMSDYVETGLTEELGVEEELGLEEELGGALDREYLGGVSQGSMLRQVPQQQLLAPIPQRSFTKQVGRAGPGYDNSTVLYGGVFSGGF